MAGLTEFIQKKKQAPPPPPPQPPVPAQEPPKKKQKKQKPKKNHEAGTRDQFYNRLRMFSSFDANDFHPTLELRLVRSSDFKITSIVQLWRKRRSDEFEWRSVLEFNPDIDNIPVSRQVEPEPPATPTEVQSDPLILKESP